VSSAEKTTEDCDRATRTHDLLLQAANTSEPAEISHIHEQVVLLNLEIAESIVARYRNRGVAVEDLVQVACLGLMKAVRGFDANKSDSFLSYAVPTILGEVKRFFRDNAWTVKPPRRIQELQAEISASAARLTQTQGSIPSAADIAADLGLGVAEVDEAMVADGCFAPSSLDRRSATVDDDSGSLADVLGEDDAGFASAEAIVALRPLCAELSERDRRIIYLRYFHEWTQARIAEEFGVTQMQISRLLARILGQLRHRLGSLDVEGASQPSAAAVS
jgi:RNA polymerase sigma-70 factor (sigma-B/F/G subfamily)